MLSATSTDLASCPRCSGPVRLTLDRFRRDVAGTGFGSFVAHHLRTYSRQEIEAALEGARGSLPHALAGQVDRWARQLLDQVEDGAARSVDTATVLDAVVRTGVSAADRQDILLGEAERLDLFEAVALELVLTVDERPELRHEIVMEHRTWASRYRWPLVACAAGVLLLAWDPAPAAEVLGWILLGLGVIPPVAGGVRRRAEGGGEGPARHLSGPGDSSVPTQSE